MTVFEIVSVLWIICGVINIGLIPLAYYLEKEELTFLSYLGLAILGFIFAPIFTVFLACAIIEKYIHCVDFVIIKGRR